jgi:predicted ATPase/DNA-binding winged helix-turn-helix (wHTH) protein
MHDLRVEAIEQCGHRPHEQQPDRVNDLLLTGWTRPSERANAYWCVTIGDPKMSGLDPKPERTFLFGPFRLSTSKRHLSDGDRTVRLGSRAMEILIALVERAGELVSKRELVDIVWPDTIVVEANLTVHVAALRRALGDGEGSNQYIVNSPGRGYRFVAPIRLVDDRRPSAEPAVAASENHNLPAQLTRLVGRANELGCLRSKMEAGRLLSIVGPPGVGKTAIALSLAESLLPSYRHGVWFVDLASITDGTLVPSALTAALPIDVRSTDILPGIAGALRYRQTLLIFDNCEHVIEGAAAAASALLKGAPDVRIITTSREPLRIEGEQVFRLPALDSPPAASPGSEDEVLDYPAVQLFVERARAIMDNFELTDADRPFVARICRGLDGNPLAIELTAARVDAFGVRGLAKRIEDRSHLLSETHRGTLPRHRSIAAALDWSYQLLTDPGRFTLNCLAVFSGSFTLEAAVAVVPTKDLMDTASVIADLVCKSLISVEIGAKEVRFRLLEITKAFALAKLIENSQRDELAGRLGAHLSGMLTRYGDGSNKVELIRNAVVELDNIRGVLTWAFAPEGRASVGIALAALAVPIWLENSLLTECIGWTGKAIEALEPDSDDERSEMILQAALGLSTMFTEGMTSRSRDALQRSTEVALRLQDWAWELRAQLGLIVFYHRRGDLKKAVALTERTGKLAKANGDAAAMAMTDSVESASLYLHGEHAKAIKLARRARAYFRANGDASQIGRWGMNHSIYAQCVIGRILWHQGLFDQTLEACAAVQSEAETSGNPTSICQALSFCNCALFISLEEFQRVAAAIERLKEVARDNELQSYLASALGYEGRLLFLTGDMDRSERLTRSALEQLGEARFENLYIPFLGHLAELLAADGRSEEALVASGESLERTRKSEALWWLPTALRIHGDVLLQAEGRNSASAESYLRQSIGLSAQQGALAEELHAATSLARLLGDQERHEEARPALRGTLSKFVEGFETVPVRRAKALLELLGDRTLGSDNSETQTRRFRG